MISAVVLAAGASSRLGSPKQLLELEGKPVLQHVIDAVGSSHADEVIVVLGHDAGRITSALKIPRNGRTIVNEKHSAGQSTSVLAGLDAAHPDTEAAVVVLGDQPRLQPRMVNRVIEAFLSRRAPFVRAAFSGSPGHPLLIARSEWATLSTISGDKGAREVIAKSTFVEDVELGGDPLQDIDTWKDYESLKDR